MPFMSSGLVSILTSITLSPFLAPSSASDALKTTLPQAFKENQIAQDFN